MFCDSADFLGFLFVCGVGIIYVCTVLLVFIVVVVGCLMVGCWFCDLLVGRMFVDFFAL